MRILITGVAGFIGFHLAKELLRQKKQVIGIDNLNCYYSPSFKKNRLKILKKNKNFKFIKLDLKQKKKLSLLFKNINPQIIYHLASQPGIMYSFKNPKTYILNNIKVTENLIENSLRYNVEKFYFTSSSSVYGNKKKFPINESSPLKPLNIYAKTKKECEKILLERFKNSNIDLKIFRPFTVYGPYARPDMIFITYLKKASDCKNFYLFNNGEYIRDFTYVEDCVNILIKFLNVNKIKNKTFNICSSQPIKIKKIIKIINNHINKRPKIILKPYRTGEMIKTYGSNSLILKHIKHKNFMSIENGIKKTINWYKNFKYKKDLIFNKF